MTRLPLCSSEQVISVLVKDGFRPRRESKAGSHRAFVKTLANGRKLVAVVPLGKKEIPRGTLSSILRQAKMSRERFAELL